MKILKSQMSAFNAYQAKVNILNERLIQKIEALPENPAITRLGKNCYTIKISDLGTTNWTPFYHDFTHQYKFLRAIIENYDINQVEQIFQEILQNGTCKLSKSLKTTDGYTFEGRHDIYRFHPDVIAFLKETL
jgi:hypothetical protein